MNDTHTPQLARANAVARKLRVPVGWLVGKLEAGELPGVRAGKVWLVNFHAIEAALLKLATENPHAPSEEVRHA